MNRRLKELAADAGYPDYMTYGQDKVLERFAELIIQECADVCQGFGESGDGYTCSYEILEHFGVEE
jgi:hypothetical protein